MTRESEVATYLRSDAALVALVPGGIYANGDLSEIGITSPVATPGVWAGGIFRTAIVVRERAPVPTGDLQNINTGHTSMSQVMEIWVYARTAEAIHAVLRRVYALMMGKRLAAAFSATWVAGMPLAQAPELPAVTLTRHEDYRVVSIRRRVAI